jgi:hypothetical protein
VTIRDDSQGPRLNQSIMRFRHGTPAPPGDLHIPEATPPAQPRGMSPGRLDISSSVRSTTTRALFRPRGRTGVTSTQTSVQAFLPPEGFPLRQDSYRDRRGRVREEHKGGTPNDSAMSSCALVDDCADMGSRLSEHSQYQARVYQWIDPIRPRISRR